jgi:hypothetical protein
VKNPQLQRNVSIAEKCDELKTIKMSELEFGTGGWPPISIYNLTMCQAKKTLFRVLKTALEVQKDVLT